MAVFCCFLSRKGINFYTLAVHPFCNSVPHCIKAFPPMSLLVPLAVNCDQNFYLAITPASSVPLFCGGLAWRGCLHGQIFGRGKCWWLTGDVTWPTKHFSVRKTPLCSILTHTEQHWTYWPWMYRWITGLRNNKRKRAIQSTWSWRSAKDEKQKRYSYSHFQVSQWSSLNYIALLLEFCFIYYPFDPVP